MSSDSQPSFIDSPPRRNALDRIWNSIQQTKILSQMLDRHPTPQHNQYREPVELELSSFEARECRKNLAHMVRKVHNLEEENKMLKYELEQEKYAHESQISSIRRQYEHRLKAELKRVRYNQKENYSYQKEPGQFDSLSRQNEKLALRLRSMELEVRSCQDERKRLAQLNDLYIQKLSEGRLGEGQLSQGQQLLQLEQANQTVNRLVELLRRTQEYREFAPMLQEVGDMHYLRTVIKRLKLNQLNYKPIEKKTYSCRAPRINQKLLWSPVECYKVMLSMKMKYDFLSQDCIEQVLFELNRLYSAKQQKIVNKLKQNHELQINKVKKQIEHSYDEILTKKQVSRLKKQLSVVKSAQKSRIPPKMDHFKDKGQLADQLKLQQKEIKLLKERIKLFQSENGYQDKSLYYEGTLSAIDKILEQLENNSASLKEFQIKFRVRVEDNLQPQDWLSSYKEFFQTLQELSGDLVERVLSLKESVLRKIGKIQ